MRYWESPLYLIVLQPWFGMKCARRIIESYYPFSEGSIWDNPINPPSFPGHSYMELCSCHTVCNKWSQSWQLPLLGYSGVLKTCGAIELSCYPYFRPWHASSFPFCMIPQSVRKQSAKHRSRIKKGMEEQANRNMALKLLQGKCLCDMLQVRPIFTNRQPARINICFKIEAKAQLSRLVNPVDFKSRWRNVCNAAAATQLNKK